MYSHSLILCGFKNPRRKDWISDRKNLKKFLPKGSVRKKSFSVQGSGTNRMMARFLKTSALELSKPHYK